LLNVAREATVFTVTALPSRPPTDPPCCPFLDALRTAPPDDEPWTEEDEAAAAEAREDARRGDVLTTDELNRLLGL
jgi:hypothetical protein